MHLFYKRTLGVLLCLPSLPVTGPPEDNFLIPFGPVANLTATQVTGRTNLPPTLLTTDTLSPVQTDLQRYSQIPPQAVTTFTEVIAEAGPPFPT